MSKTIIALGAHADDIDLQAGATLSKYIREGYKIIYCVVTTSASGIPGVNPNEAYNIRHREALAAGKLYNSEVIFLDYHQCNYPHGSTLVLPEVKPLISIASRQIEAIDTLTKLLEKHDPEIVMTHVPFDLHEDHYYTSILVFRAWQNATKSTDSQLLLWRPSHLGSIIEFNPDYAVEINEDDLKVQEDAIRTHTSQYERTPWFRSFAKNEAVKCGEQFHYKYAQPFIKIEKKYER